MLVTQELDQLKRNKNKPPLKKNTNKIRPIHHK